MGAMLAEDGIVRAAPDGQHHFPPRAKSVIWVFLSGGYSHLETFDPKPAINRYAGKTYAETPYPNPVDSPLHRMRFRSVARMMGGNSPIRSAPRMVSTNSRVSLSGLPTETP